MTTEEYKLKLTELEQKHKREMNALHIEYANANNPYKIGDIISDHTTTIRIEKIQTTFGAMRIPFCVYEGVALKKNGEPNARGKKESIWQTNIR